MSRLKDYPERKEFLWRYCSSLSLRNYRILAYILSYYLRLPWWDERCSCSSTLVQRCLFSRISCCSRFFCNSYRSILSFSLYCFSCYFTLSMRNCYVFYWISRVLRSLSASRRMKYYDLRSSSAILCSIFLFSSVSYN